MHWPTSAGLPMRKRQKYPRAALRPLDLPTLVLTTGGLGFMRPAPGTWGSIPPAAVAALAIWAGVPAAVSITLMLVWSVLASAGCIRWGRFAETRFGRKDASEVVADETAGVCLPVAAALFAGGGAVFWLLLAAFALFRVFDIAKPFPMRRLEKLPYGWGVLLDDLMAGVYAAAGVIMLAVKFTHSL